MSGRDERPGSRRRTTRRRPSAWRIRPREDNTIIRREPDEERGERENGFTAIPAREEMLRDLLTRMQRRDGSLEDGEDPDMDEESLREREMLLTERRAMQNAIEEQGNPLGEEIINFVEARPEIYTLPMANRGFFAIAEMLAPEAPSTVWNHATRIAIDRLNGALTECESDAEYEALQEEMNIRLTPPPPNAELVEEMTRRIPGDTDRVTEFIAEHSNLYPRPVRSTTILGVIELLGLSGPDFYLQALLESCSERIHTTE